MPYFICNILFNSQISMKYNYCYSCSTDVEIISELDMPYRTSSSVIFRLLKWWNPFIKNLVKVPIYTTNESKSCHWKRKVGRKLPSPSIIICEAALLHAMQAIWKYFHLRDEKTEGEKSKGTCLRWGRCFTNDMAGSAILVFWLPI